MAKKATSPDVASPSPDQEDWETKDHFNTIMKAHEIMEDPAKMEKIHAHAGRHKKALEHLTKMKPIDDGEKPIRSIKEMKAKAQKKFGAPKA